MWHAPNQRVRAAAIAKKRERDRARRPIHIKRLNAQLEIPSLSGEGSTQSQVRLLLNDLSPKGIGLYVTMPLIVGQEIILAVTEPRNMKIRSKVIWCQEYAASSHILSSHSFSHRAGLEFVLTDEEEIDMKEFCDDVLRNHLNVVKSV